MSRRILVVDDEKAIRRSLCNVLEDEQYEVVLAETGEEGLERAEGEDPDLVLLDIWLPGMDGLETLTKIKERFPALPVLMMSGHGTIETAVKATKLGAYDFIEKPLNLDKMLLSIEHALNASRLKAENLFLRDRVGLSNEMTGESPPVQEVREQIRIVGPTRASVLITGENGTGKELVARAIHNASDRAANAFVEVNCAAIPETLIESELFGHEKGSFTGASGRRRGKFDLADTGTLFLDEIGDMSLTTQAKILRVLQEMRYERVGGNRTYEVDVRVIAATNKDLEEEIQAGNFREDLYFRLNVIPVHLAPLRERAGDVPLLVQEFKQASCAEYGWEGGQISDDVMEALMAHDWPGNVRELKNVVERMVILSRGGEITQAQLPPGIQTGSGAATVTPTLASEVSNAPLKEARKDFERRYILRHLQENEWNVAQTATSIGMERSSLYKKMKELSIETP